MQYLFLFIGLATLVFYLSKRTADVRLPVVLLKSVVSVSFIAFSAFSAVYNEKFPMLAMALFVCGGVCGLLGDVYLDFKYLYKNHSDTYLNAGFISFLVGHIFYSLALLKLYPANYINYLIAAEGGMVVVISIPITERLMGLAYGKFKKITALYCFVLGFTTALSFSFIITAGVNIHTVVLHVALMLFLGSDAFLSTIYFSTNEKDRTNRVTIVLNHLFYYAAQFLIAASINLYRG